MKTQDEALAWLTAEILDEAVKMVAAERQDDMSVRQFANGCIDGYVRAANHLGIAPLSQMRKIVDDAIKKAKADQG
jgi:hypothetical protein